MRVSASAAPPAAAYDIEGSLMMSEVSDVVEDDTTVVDDNTSDDDDDDDTSDDNDDGGDDAVFFCAARDIMNRVGVKGCDGSKGGPPLPRALQHALHDRANGVGYASGGGPAPQERRAEASALDALFF
jgi:hypothetical protein